MLREGLRGGLPGTARSEHARHAHESPPTMLGPMGVLVACCFLIGLAPLLIAPILGQGSVGLGTRAERDRAPPGRAGPPGLDHGHGPALVAALIVAGVVLWLRLRRTPWQRRHLGLRILAHRRRGCSTPRPPSPRCWSGCSAGCFARARTGPGICRCSRGRPISTARCPTRCSTRSVLPAFRFGAWLFSWFRVFQQGNIQAYLLYIFVALIVLLLWR